MVGFSIGLGWVAERISSVAMAAWLPSSRVHPMVAAAAALLLTAMAAAPAAVALLHDDVEPMWGADHISFHTGPDGVETLALRLDKDHGSGFRSRRAYRFARYDIDLKLVANDSAGTVTTVYVSSPTSPAAAGPPCLLSRTARWSPRATGRQHYSPKGCHGLCYCYCS